MGHILIYNHSQWLFKYINVSHVGQLIKKILTNSIFLNTDPSFDCPLPYHMHNIFFFAKFVDSYEVKTVFKLIGEKTQGGSMKPPPPHRDGVKE